MRGLPNILATREDWKNAFRYAEKDEGLKKELTLRLQSLRSSKTCKVLKDGDKMTKEEPKPEDFVAVIDPRSPFALSGLEDSEVDEMIGGKWPK